MTNNFTVVNEDRHYANIDVVVAMAVYQGDKLSFVKQAVTSILVQTHTSFIFCIAIDGPINSTIKDFLWDEANKDNRIVLLEGKQNLGLSICMNYIIDWVKVLNPIYLFRMDADDISEPERLAIQRRYLENHPDIAVLGSGLIEINESGKKVGARRLPAKNQQIVDLLPRRCAINHPTVAIRYSVLGSGFRYIEGKNITEDYFLWAEMAAKGYKFHNIPKQLLQFRRSGGFYKRRGMHSSFSEFKARLYTMKVLNKRTLFNYTYACLVLCLRAMPVSVIKLAYKADRMLLDKLINN